MSYDIVPYDSAYRDQVAQLWCGLWGRDPALNARLLEWRHERNPYSERPMLHLALDDGRVVGSRGAYASRWVAGQPAVTVDLACVGDTVIDDKHRERGLLDTLTEQVRADARERGYPHLLNLSATAPTFLASIFAGWRTIGSWPVLARECDTTDEASEGATGSGAAAGKPQPSQAALFGSLEANAERHAGSVSREVRLAGSVEPEVLARMAARVDKGGRIRHEKDARYLAWRLANPRCAYRCLYFGSDPIDGYVLLQATPARGGFHVRVVDIEGMNGEIQAELLRAVVEWGNFPNTLLWWLRLPRQALALVSESGFRQRVVPSSLGRRLPTVLVQSLAAPGDGSAYSIGGINMLELANWDVRMLHSDAT